MIKGVATILLLVGLFAAPIPVKAVEGGANGLQIRVVSTTGSVVAEAPDPKPAVDGQPLDRSTILTLGAGAHLRLATGCGALIEFEGPRTGTIETILRSVGVNTNVSDCAAITDVRKTLILSFLAQSPERVFRGGPYTGATDPLDLDLDAASPACFVPGQAFVMRGDTQRLGDTLDIQNPDTGDRDLAYFDASLMGWQWPGGVPLAAGHFIVATRLAEIDVQLKPLPDGVSGEALARALVEAGCLQQARRLLPRLAADVVVPPQR